jgi:hypothetical protein
MQKIKRLCIPMVLGMLLIATLTGVANARPGVRPQEQAWRVLTVPSTVCVPQDDDDDWVHGANLVLCSTGQCLFFCAVDFPAAGEQAVGAVNVKRVTMFAYDNSGDEQAATFTLYKTYPPAKVAVGMAGGNTLNSADDPQTVMDMTIAHNPVYRVQGPTVSLAITGTGINVYGFYIHYTW